MDLIPKSNMKNMFATKEVISSVAKLNLSVLQTRLKTFNNSNLFAI